MTRAIHFNHITPALSLSLSLYRCSSDCFIIIIVRAHICTMYRVSNSTFMQLHMKHSLRAVFSNSINVSQHWTWLWWGGEQWDHSVGWKSPETRLSNPLIELPETLKMCFYVISVCVNLFGQQLKSFSNRATGRTHLRIYVCLIESDEAKWLKIERYSARIYVFAPTLVNLISLLFCCLSFGLALHTNFNHLH